MPQLQALFVAVLARDLHKSHLIDRQIDSRPCSTFIPNLISVNSQTTVLMSQSNSNIYVLYNANGSLLGKLNYVCRKLTSSSDDSACAACDLTHGGLKLDESPQWKQTKQRIGGASIHQLHRDELNPEVSPSHRF